MSNTNPTNSFNQKLDHTIDNFGASSAGLLVLRDSEVYTQEQFEKHLQEAKESAKKEVRDLILTEIVGEDLRRKVVDCRCGYQGSTSGEQIYWENNLKRHQRNKILKGVK